MSSLLGKITSAIVRATGNTNPSTIEKKKTEYIKALRDIENVFTAYYPPIGYSFKKFDANGVPAEFFEKKKGKNDKLIFVLHGGAYVTRLVFIYRWMNGTYSRAGKGASVLHFDYRCTPEHKYPCALEDAEKVWNWALENGYKEENIITIGDSAGGHLNISLMMKLRQAGRKLPKATIFISPWLDMTGSGKSYKENFHIDPVFGIKGKKGTDEDVQKFISSGLYGWYGNEDPRDPYISPVFAELDEGYPPTLVTVGGNEMIKSDSETLVKKLTEAGVPAELHVEDGMFHVFNYYRFLPESIRTVKKMREFIRKHFFEDKRA